MNPVEVQRYMAPRFMSAAEVLALPNDPAEQWIWEQTLRPGQLSLLVAKPRIGKSTFGANLALAIARGVPFLGRDTQRAPVAYLSLDATLEETLEIFRDFGMTTTDHVFFYPQALPQNPVQWLTQQIKETKIRFAVVDTLQHFFHFQDANSYSDVTNRMGPLLAAARKEKCHICFLHHARKGDGDDLDSGIGSQAIKGNCSSFMHLKRLPNSIKRVLTTDLRRGSNFENVVIGFGTNGWLGVEGDMEGAEIQIAKPQILKTLEVSEEGLTEADLRSAISMRQWIVGQAIRQLLSAGEVDRTGKGKRGSPYRYSTLAGLSSPKERVIGKTIPGRENGNHSEVLETSGKVSSPKNSGLETDEKGREKKGGESGRESKKGIIVDDVLREFPGSRVLAVREADLF